MNDIQKLMADIEAAEKRVAAERDKLDAIISHAQELADDCEGAIECLQDARANLSELV